MAGQERFPSLERSEKKRRWDEIAGQMEMAPDKLEYPIDAGVKEGVIALNALDIHTASSCEGHVDREAHAPRIDIQAQEAERLTRKWKDAKEKGESEGKLKNIIAEIERRNLEERKKLFPHLEEFYKDKEVPFDRRLIISGGTRGWSRLESQGAALQQIESEEVMKRRLSDYQEEMRAFASFLKEKYFKEQ